MRYEGDLLADGESLRPNFPPIASLAIADACSTRLRKVCGVSRRA